VSYEVNKYIEGCGVLSY